MFRSDEDMDEGEMEKRVLLASFACADERSGFVLGWNVREFCEVRNEAPDGAVWMRAHDVRAAGGVAGGGMDFDAGELQSRKWCGAGGGGYV